MDTLFLCNIIDKHKWRQQNKGGTSKQDVRDTIMIQWSYYAITTACEASY